MTDDLDAIEANARHWRSIYGEPTLALVAEVRRLRAERDALCVQADGLVALVGWLHPDPAPDPITAKMLERDSLLDVLLDALAGQGVPEEADRG